MFCCLREQKKRGDRIVQRAVALKDLDEARSEERKERLKELSEGVAGSHDTGDPSTTNLYVGNLAPQVHFHLYMLSGDNWFFLL